MELKGTVSGLTGTCPAITFVVLGSTVITSPTTDFHEGRCAGIANGDQVEVRGTRQSNGTILADRVDDDDDDDEAGVVELKGTVSGRSGTCPAITFSVAGTTVATNASTVFDDATCARLVNGDRIEVKGTRQANGSVLATRIEDEEDEDDEDDREVELKGTLSGKAGTCPAITFAVAGSSVATNASTRFDDTTCSALGNGDRVEVKGTRQSNGMVAASRVEKE